MLRPELQAHFPISRRLFYPASSLKVRRSRLPHSYALRNLSRSQSITADEPTPAWGCGSGARGSTDLREKHYGLRRITVGGPKAPLTTLSRMVPA